ncbi:hypothetical protein PG996_000231 [Apiospora saccharicola]|uniref:Uncharacterized protein n=1 Tax=Apiospora saccharicola TaxID=335842 RepID=A0ABR1WD74_9PEZI
MQARQCPDFKYIDEELRAGCLGPGNVAKRNHSHGDGDFFSTVWTKVDAIGRYYKGSLDWNLYRICSWCGDRVLSRVADAHPSPTVPRGGQNAFCNAVNGYSAMSQERINLPGQAAAVPRGLLASWVTMQGNCGDTLAHRISKWMMISFIESASQRELLRTSPLITTSRFRLQEKGGGGDGAGDDNDAEENWVVPVLRFWNRDGLPITNDEQRTAGEDGGGGGSPGHAGGDESDLRPSSSPAVVGADGVAKPIEPVLTIINHSDNKDKGKSRSTDPLLPSVDAEVYDDDDNDGRSASPNSAIWSQEIEARPPTGTGKRAASPSPMFEFTAGAKRVKV